MMNQEFSNLPVTENQNNQDLVDLRIQKLELQIEVLKKKHEEQDHIQKKSFQALKQKFLTFDLRVLNRTNLIRIMFWLISIGSLTYGSVFYISSSITDFLSYEVITQIRFRLNENSTFPAITFCFQDVEFKPDFTSNVIRNLNFSDALKECYFESSINKCTINDFEYYEVNNSQKGTKYTCHKFNGGRNASGHSVPLLFSTKFGKYTGLTIIGNMTKKGYFYYFVGDNHVRPVFLEFYKYLQPRNNIYVGIKKTVDRQLPEPYNSCKKVITSETSHLVKKILEQNITYRKVTCYDFCLEEYASKNKLSIKDVINGNDFNYTEDCSELCPLECDSNLFETVENVNIIDDGSSYSYLKVNFHYMDDRYTEMIQAVKITEADLVSNTGGVIGLFLDISFYHAYKFLAYIIDMVISLN